MTAKLISSFVFATRIVQSLSYLNPKFKTSSHPLWVYSLVCVRPGRKPRRLVFSLQGLYLNVRFKFVTAFVKLRSHSAGHLRKPRVLSPLRSLRTLGRSAIQKSKLPLRHLLISASCAPYHDVILGQLKGS